MIYFNNFFKIPGPKDLGMSASNYAMPARGFERVGEYTWEDYYHTVKSVYPIKFFLASTLPLFFLRLWWSISRPFSTFHYWLVSHTIRRYHILDLRQPSSDISDADYYRYGWIDTDRRMEFALFNLLTQFMEVEWDNKYFPTEEVIQSTPEDQREVLRQQRDDMVEIKAIYDWWIKDRKLEKAREAQLLNEWHDAHINRLPQATQLHKELDALEAFNYHKLEEMMIRLIKVRGRLWT